MLKVKRTTNLHPRICYICDLHASWEMATPSDNESNKKDTLLSLLTTINNGLQDILGRGANGIIFNTGVDEGRRIAKDLPKTDTIHKAVESVNEAYRGVWKVELHNSGEEGHFFIDEFDRPSFRVMVRDCPVRAAVTEKDLKQEGPLCYLTNGYLCGMLSTILNENVGMEIEHAGPLACRKRVFFRE